jgi:prepilin-type N-terminal cleavage/methylation domain-containing protein
MRSSQGGFTLIELMIVVVILGVLARVALPAFTAESNKSKARSEVAPMFAELANKELQYKAEKASFLTAAACPAAPAQTGQSAAACVGAGQVWNTLRVALPEQTLYCSYAITTGTSAQTPTPPAPYAMPAQASGWYYIVATCDMDGKAGNSTYFVSSWDSKIQANAEGT